MSPVYIFLPPLPKCPILPVSVRSARYGSNVHTRTTTRSITRLAGFCAIPPVSARSELVARYVIEQMQPGCLYTLSPFSPITPVQPVQGVSEDLHRYARSEQ